MLAKTLIDPTVNAVNKILIIENLNLNGSVSLLGTVITESIIIQIPKVENPDINTDSDWANYVVDGDNVILNVNNNALGIHSRGTYRLVKLASPGNPFGVRFA